MSDPEVQPGAGSAGEVSGAAGAAVPKKLVFTVRRIILWAVVGAVGIYLVIEGTIGMITKAR